MRLTDRTKTFRRLLRHRHLLSRSYRTGCARCHARALPAVTDAETALDAATPVIHPELGDNLTFERKLDAGEPDEGFAHADEVIEAVFRFGRHTGVCNEPRAIVADWNPGEQRLTVYHGTQAPHMMQNLFAKHLGLEEQQVRICPKCRLAQTRTQTVLAKAIRMRRFFSLGKGPARRKTRRAGHLSGGRDSCWIR